MHIYTVLPIHPSLASSNNAICMTTSALDTAVIISGSVYTLKLLIIYVCCACMYASQLNKYVSILQALAKEHSKLKVC